MAYHKLFTFPRASGAFPAAPFSGTFYLVSARSLKVGLCPKSNTRATQHQAFRLCEFLGVEPAEHCLIARTNLLCHLFGRIKLLHALTLHDRIGIRPSCW